MEVHQKVVNFTPGEVALHLLIDSVTEALLNEDLFGSLSLLVMLLWQIETGKGFSEIDVHLLQVPFEQLGGLLQVDVLARDEDLRCQENHQGVVSLIILVHIDEVLNEGLWVEITSEYGDALGFLVTF